MDKDFLIEHFQLQKLQGSFLSLNILSKLKHKKIYASVFVLNEYSYFFIKGNYLHFLLQDKQNTSGILF